MEQLYIALIDTPGLFASIIRKTIGIPYIHVAISMDAELTQAYSFGRRNPAIPFFAGFEKEISAKIVDVFPSARYRIISLPCTTAQKRDINAKLTNCYKKRLHYHYNVIGLPFILLNIPFSLKHHHTCTSFISKLLTEHGISLFDKHFSLVNPRDFYELTNTTLIYEGTLANYQSQIDSQCSTQEHIGAAYES
jgi:hypothetical protein